MSKNIFMIFLSIFFPIVSLAYIPHSSHILSRVADNAGSGYYQIEQEVQFPNGQDTLTLKETWLIENENNMKLIVTGTRDYKDSISFAYTYGPSTKRKVSDDFITKYFFMRSSEQIAQLFTKMDIAPAGFLHRKIPHTLKEVNNNPENYVRLARSGGVITYAFGQASPSAEKPLPGFWIEQDQFVLRKFRLPSQTEVTADEYSAFAKGLMYPKSQNIHWKNNQISIHTISVAAKSKELWNTFGAKVPTKEDALKTLPAAGLVEEFYERFR